MPTALKRNSAKDDELLKDIRERFTYLQEQWRDIREEATTDMRYVSGDPWDEREKKARKDNNRPCLALDELGQYVNQLINDIRQNKRAVQEADTSDAKDYFVIDQIPRKEFKKRWPKATITDFTPEICQVASQWINYHQVQIAEYWKVEDKSRKLVSVKGQDGQPLVMWHDELPKGYDRHFFSHR
jgi:hypothetical protein